MLPDLVIGQKVISAYMIMALIGVFVTMFYLMHLARKYGLDDMRVLVMVLLGFTGALVGSHMLGGLLNYDAMIYFFGNLGHISSFQDFLDKATLVFGNSVFYGGLIGALIVGFIYLKRTEWNIRPYMDIAALAVPLFHGFGRIGCFLSGCCYGVPWACGVTYHYSQAPGANDVARFPVQLVEAVLNFGLFFFLRWLFTRKKASGKLMYLYLIVYPIYRFLLEFLRDDSYRGFFLGLSTSQLISLILLVFSCGMLVLEHFRKPVPKKAPANGAPEDPAAAETQEPASDGTDETKTAD